MEKARRKWSRADGREGDLAAKMIFLERSSFVNDDHHMMVSRSKNITDSIMLSNETKTRGL